MAAWFTVYDQLLAKLPTISGLSAATVFDGPVITDTSAPSLAIVGDNGSNDAGSFTPGFSEVTALDEEAGEIYVRLIARSGKASVTALRATASGWVSALTTWFRADMTLGGALSQGSTIRVSRVAPRQVESSDGALVELVVTIDYFTRL